MRKRKRLPPRAARVSSGCSRTLTPSAGGGRDARATGTFEAVVAELGAPGAPPVLEREPGPVVRDLPGLGAVPARAARGPDAVGEAALDVLVEGRLHLGADVHPARLLPLERAHRLDHVVDLALEHVDDRARAEV